MKMRSHLLLAAAVAAAEVGSATGTGSTTTTKPAEPQKPAEPKLNAGDKAIKACQADGATNGQLQKAIWSTRGNIYVHPEGFNSPVAIVKADMTTRLKSAKAEDLCGFHLKPRAGKDGGADLIAIKKVAPGSKK
jgi:hypothetical protein